jgi:polyphosphate kinase
MRSRLNKDLSWLAYNARILQEARDNTVPLLQRKEFLEFFRLNLEKFKRKRLEKFSNKIEKASSDIERKQLTKLASDIENTIVHHQYEFDIISQQLISSITQEETVFSYQPIPSIYHQDLVPFDNYFEVLNKKNVLLYYPYHSFDHVIKLLNCAYVDPGVKEINITLFRAARGSIVIHCLKIAAQNGKKIRCFLEPKARDDEASREYIERELDSPNIQLFVGHPDYKIHSKALLIKRVTEEGYKCYSYLSTGNFNEKNAKIYTDLGLMTSDDVVGRDLETMFDYMEYLREPLTMEKLVMSPFSLRDKLLKLIKKETKIALKGEKAFIHAKMNSLEDKKIIEKLYEASQAGVEIKLLVRGVCCLMAGVRGLSENIQVYSIIDRFLEHSRIFVFGNGGDELAYASSADLMKRNFDKRFELMFPIEDRDITKEALTIMDFYFKDNVKARVVDPDHRNHYKISGNKEFHAQIQLHNYFKEKAK